ncbi:hypothetical protein [Vannielia litorea]|uniref:hypothetical protein n=1 Tax=Vannielia litorea TaxID=1217970 RepID=UPI001BCCE184|nr:hypothetical protein [Vannielia litorea]
MEEEFSRKFFLSQKSLRRFLARSETEKSWARFFGSHQNVHRRSGTDDDVLATGLDQMETPPSHFEFKSPATDPSMNFLDLPAHDTARLHRFCGEDLLKPLLIGRDDANLVHDSSFASSRLTSG